MISCTCPTALGKQQQARGTGQRLSAKELEMQNDVNGLMHFWGSTVAAPKSTTVLV